MMALRQSAAGFLAALALTALFLLPNSLSAQEAPKPPSPFTWLEGHKSPLYSVAWSPDGKTFLSGAVDGSIGVWDAATGKLIRMIRDPRGATLSLAIAKDNLRFAAGGRDRKVRLYDLPSMHPVSQMAAAIPGVPTAITVSADGKLVFTADGARIVRLWNPDNNQALRDFPGSTGEIGSLAVLPELRTILAASKDGFVRSWNIDNATVGPAFSIPAPNAIAATPDGKQLAIGSEDGILRLASWPGAIPANLATFGDAITSVAVTPDGKAIVVGAADSQVILYNSETNAALRTMAGQPGKTSAVAVSPDGVITASGSETGFLKFWQTADGADRMQLGGHTGVVTSLGFHPKLPIAVSSGADGTIRLWNVPTPPKQIPGHTQPLQVVAVDRKGTVMATAAGDKSVRLFKVADGAAIRSLEQLPQAASAIAFSDDAAKLAVGDLAGNVRIESTNDGKNVVLLGAHNAPVSGLVFHPDGQKLVSVGHDGSLKFWTIPAAVTSPGATLPEQVTALAISPDGKIAVSGSNDGSAVAYDPAKPAMMTKLVAPGSGPVTSLAVSADSSLAAVGLGTGSIKLTNPADGADKLDVAGHVGAVTGLAFAPGKLAQFASTGADGTARVWKIPTAPTSLAAHAKPAQAIAVTSDGKIAITGGEDGLAQIVTLPEGKPSKKLTGTDAAVKAVAIRKDGTEAATADATGLVRLHNPVDGLLRSHWGAHEGPITGIAYPPTQPMIATVGADGTTKLWQLPIVPAVELLKHADGVTAISVSADGQTVVSAGADKAIRVHAANAARQLGAARSDVVRSLALSGDNSFVVVGNETGSISVLNLADAVLKANFGGHGGAVTAVAVHPANQQIASVGTDGSLRVWELVPPPVVLAGHAKPLTVAVLSPNGQWLATASGDNTVRLWNVSNNTAGPVLTGHAGAVQAIAWRADSTQIVTGGADKSVRTWNAADGKQLAALEGSEGAVNAVALSPDGAKVYAGGTDKTIRIWTTADMKPAMPIAGHTDAITGMHLLANGATLATSSKDGTIRTWATADGKAGLNINAAGAVNALAVSTDEKTFAAAGQDKIVRLFNAADGAAGPVAVAASQPIVHVAFSKDNLKLSSVTADGVVQILDPMAKLLETVLLDKAPSTAAVFGADNRTLYAAGGDNNARLVKLGLLRMAAISQMPLASVSWTADGNSLVTGGADKTARLVTAATLAVAKEYPGHTDSITSVAVTKDGQKLFAAGADKNVRVWRLADAGVLPALVHPAAVKTVTLSADGLRAITGCDDNSVRVWDVASGKLIERFLDPTKPVIGVGYSADGKTVVSASSDGSVRRHTAAIKWFALSHEGGGHCVTFNHDGSAVLSGGADKLLKQFDLNGSLTRSFAGIEGAVKTVAVRGDGMQVAAGCDNAQICQWRYNDAGLERKLPGIAAVNSVAYSADHLRLVAGCLDQHIRVFQAMDGLLLEDVTTPAVVTGVTFGAENLTVVATHADNTPRLYALSLLRVLGPHVGGATAVAWAPDGSSLFSGGNDKNIVQWNLQTGAQIRPFAGHTDFISSLGISADAQRLVSTSADRTIRVWGVPAGNLLTTITHTQPMRQAGITPDGNRGVTLDDGNTLRTWDFVSGRELERIAGHETGTTRVAISADGKLVMSGGVDKTTRLWNVSAMVAVAADLMKVNDLAILPDGSQVVTAGDDKIVKLWDWTGKVVRQFGGPQTPVRNVAVNHDGTAIAAGGDPQYTQPQLFAWKTADAAVLVNVTLPSPITSLAFTGDGRLAAASVDKRLRAFNTADAKPLEDSPLPAVFTDLAILPDNKTTLGAGNDNFGYLGQLALRRMFTGHEGAVAQAIFLPDGERVVSCGPDKTIRIWNAADGKPLGTFAGSAAAVASVAVSGDGKWLAAGGGETLVRTWSIPEAGQPAADVAAAKTFTHPVAVRNVKLSADGSRLLTAAEDGAVRIWDASSGLMLESLLGASGAAFTATYSPDGKFIVTGGADRIPRKFVPVVVAAVKAHEGRIADVKVSADGSQIFSAGADGTVAAWTTDGMKPVGRMSGAEGALRSVDVSDDGKTIAAGGEAKTLTAWKAGEEKPFAAIVTPDVIQSVIVADGGKKFLVSGVDKSIRSYGIATVDGKPEFELIQEFAGHPTAVPAIALTGDDHILYSAGADQILRRWHSANYGPLKELDGNEGPVYCVEFNADGKWLASGGGDGKIRVWTVADGKSAFECEGHTRSVNSIAFHPAGTELTSAGGDGAIRIWNAVPPPVPVEGKPVDPKAADKPALGAKLEEIAEGVDGEPLSLILSRDNNYLFAAGTSNVWQSWTRKDLKPGRTFVGHNQPIYKIAYNPAGTRIATLDYSGKLILWNVSDGNIGWHVQLPTSTATSFAYSLNGQELIFATRDPRLLKFQIPQVAW